MSFFVIEFVEGGLAVVPSVWLTPRKKEVYWPPVKDTILYKKLVKRQEEVDENSWKLYSVQKVFCETGKYFYFAKFEFMFRNYLCKLG